MKHRFCSLITLLTFGCCAFLHLAGSAQSNLSLKFLGLTVHPAGDPTADLQPNKLDPKARFVMNFGGVVAYERYIWEDLVSVKGLQAVFLDCSAGLASATHIAIRATFLNRKKHRASVGFGPALYVRQDWNRFENYESSGFMNRGYLKPVGTVQWKLFWYGVELEYDYQVSDRLDVSASLTPGLPMVITLGAGIKYWLNKDFRHKLYLPKIK